MAQEGTPLVRGGYLHLSGERPIPLDSARWFSWLGTACLFSYHSSCGRRMTLRQEKRRHSSYWGHDIFPRDCCAKRLLKCFYSCKLIG